MAEVKVFYLMTSSAGELIFDVGSLRGRGVTEVLLLGGGYDLSIPIDDGYPSVIQVEPFVAGATYNLSITFVTDSGDYTTAVALKAEPVAGDPDYVGYTDSGFMPTSGELVPDRLSAPALPSSGPESTTSLYALIPFFSDQASMCSHPSLVYNPAFQPSSQIAWLYLKAANGEETVSLVAAPDSRYSGDYANVWLSPTGVPHFVRVQEKPEQGEFGTFTFTALSMEPAPYGTEPAPPSPVVTFSYIPATDAYLDSVSLHWEGEGTPVLGANMIDRRGNGGDVLLLGTPSAFVVNRVQRESYYGSNTFVRLDTGYHYASVQEEI